MFDHKNCANLPLAIHLTRLRCVCRFRQGHDVESQWHRCVIDTGAGKTTIPESFWYRFARQLGVHSRPRTGLQGVGGRRLEAVAAELQLEVAGTDNVDLPDRPGFPWEDNNPGILCLGTCNVLLAFDQKAANEFNAN